MSYNRIPGIMTWRSKSYQCFSYMTDSSAAFSDKFKGYCLEAIYHLYLIAWKSRIRGNKYVSQLPTY